MGVYAHFAFIKSEVAFVSPTQRTAPHSGLQLRSYPSGRTCRPKVVHPSNNGPSTTFLFQHLLVFRLCSEGVRSEDTP